jgi:hypothetical protein
MHREKEKSIKKTVREKEINTLQTTLVNFTKISSNHNLKTNTRINRKPDSSYLPKH